MNKIELHKFLKFYSYFMLVALNFCVIPLYAQLPYSDTFKSNQPADLIICGASNGATFTSGSIDPAGEGYLRLTNSQTNQSGYVQSTKSFPSADGLSISFEYFTYGGTGGDGITFFLYDATAIPFNIGTFGGSLGYAQNASSPGLSKGFLALGLDEFGNFSNPTAGRVGGPGSVSSSVLLRGDGNGLGPGTLEKPNYGYLKGISTNSTLDMNAVGAGGIFHVAGEVNGRTEPSGFTPLNSGYRKAKVDMIPNGLGTGFILNVWITEGSATGAIVHQVIKNQTYIPTNPIPQNLSYGFSASTGAATNFHEIRNLEILKPLDPTLIPTLANVNVEGIENVELLFKSSDFTSKFNQVQSLPLAKIKIQNLPKYGVLKLNGNSVAIGQEINLTDIVQLKFVAETDFSGTSSFQWNGSDGNNYASSNAFVNLNITGFNPSFPYLESFMKASASGLIKRGSPNPAELTSGTIDPNDAGYLRLTKNQSNQTAYAYSTKNFPSENGLSISFDYYMHGASGDGISFFLFDAAANPFSIGAFGGSLGYTQNHSVGGVSKAFLGLGIDEFGNFSNSGTGRQGGPGKFSGSITLRGDGDGVLAIPSNYEYLTHTQTNNLADMSAIGANAGSPFPLSGNINGRTAGIAGLDPLKTGYRRLKIDFVPNELAPGFLINVWITEGKTSGEVVHQVIKDYNYIPTSSVPTNLRYGFSAGNGNTPTIYEIRNLEILLPSNKVHKPILKSIELSGYEDQDLVFQVSDFEQSFFDPSATKSLKNVEFTSLPLLTDGVLKLDGLDVRLNQKIPVVDISSGKLKFSPASDLNGKLSTFKWNGYTSSNDVKAEVDENVLITLSAVNDSPLSENIEILIGSKENALAGSNFKLTDPKDNNLHTLKAVKIITTPGLGMLRLDNTLITAGQFITIDDISSGKFTFTPALHGSGNPYTSFTFQVQDNGGQDHGGIDLSQAVNTFKINVAPIPSIELGNADISICMGSSTAGFNYTSLNGEPLPNSYRIDWDETANAAGLADITNKDLLSGTIAIDNLSNIIAGNYNGLLTVLNKGYNVLSIAKPISLNIKPLLRAEISYGAEAFCNNGKTMVTFSGETGGIFTSSAGLIINELTGEVNLTQSTPGSYIISYTLSNGVCSIVATAPLIIKAMSVIAAITGSNSVIAGFTTQLASTTAGGTWRSSNMEVLTVNSLGLASGLKRGEVQISYVVRNEGCIDSVSFQVNVSRAKALDMSKITYANTNINFSSSEYYSLIDSVTRVNDLAKSAMNRIRIESLPSNGKLKINGIPVYLAQEILFTDISGLIYTPDRGFSGTDIFKWNWADIAGNYGELSANVSIAVTASSPFKIVSVSDVKIDEKTQYTSNALEFYGEPIGKISYSLSGKDSGLFTINELTGIVSMSARDFDLPLDWDKDNNYEVQLLAKDYEDNLDSLDWKVSIQRVLSSPAQSVLSPDSISLPLDKNNPQKLTVTTRYANGDNYLKGGELVVFNKISGSAAISEVTDHGDGTYTAMVYSGSNAGRNVFVATLAGKEIRNGSSVQARAIVDFFTLGDNRLKDLSLSRGTLLPQFKSDVFDYSASVGYFSDSIAISPALIDQSAKIKINGVGASVYDSQIKIPLKTGENIISILISAKDGLSQRTYTININRFPSSLPYRESFMNNTGDGLVFGGFPNQANLTSGSIDETGKGYLRLTNNKLNEAGFIHNYQKFSSAKGLSISFEYFSHGGTGGDGLSFYLFDASANFSIGAFGGSLGYAQSSASAGLSKGFIGLGFDALGEFGNPSSNKQGGPGRRPSSVILRGDGDGKIGNLGTNYEYLGGLQTIEAAVMKVAGAGNTFSVFGNQDGRNFESELKGSDVEGYRKAKIELVPMGNKPGFIINVWITEGTKSGGIVHHVIKNYSYIPTDGIPMDLKYGFAASNGNSTNIYEVRNLEIKIPNLSESPDLDTGNGGGTIENPNGNSISPLATNLITPNGDGINDTWVIRNIDDFKNSSLRIFNRSGQEIYKTENYKNDWDGRKGGILLPKGTYYYVIEIGNSEPSFKGYITIL